MEYSSTRPKVLVEILMENIKPVVTEKFDLEIQAKSLLTALFGSFGLSGV